MARQGKPRPARAELRLSPPAARGHLRAGSAPPPPPPPASVLFQTELARGLAHARPGGGSWPSSAPGGLRARAEGTRAEGNCAEGNCAAPPHPHPRYPLQRLRGSGGNAAPYRPGGLRGERISQTGTGGRGGDDGFSRVSPPGVTAAAGAVAVAGQKLRRPVRSARPERLPAPGGGAGGCLTGYLLRVPPSVCGCVFALTHMHQPTPPTPPLRPGEGSVIR